MYYLLPFERWFVRYTFSRGTDVFPLSSSVFILSFCAGRGFPHLRSSVVCQQRGFINPENGRTWAASACVSICCLSAQCCKYNPRSHLNILHLRFFSLVFVELTLIEKYVSNLSVLLPYTSDFKHRKWNWLSSPRRVLPFLYSSQILSSLLMFLKINFERKGNLFFPIVYLSKLWYYFGVGVGVRIRITIRWFVVRAGMSKLLVCRPYEQILSWFLFNKEKKAYMVSMLRVQPSPL